MSQKNRKKGTEVGDYLEGYARRRWELVVGAEGRESEDKEEFHDLEPTTGIPASSY